MIGDILIGLNHFSFTLSLDSEDVRNVPLVLLVLVAIHITSVINVVPDHLILWALNLKWIDDHVHCVIHVVNWVHFLLLEEGTKEHL